MMWRSMNSAPQDKIFGLVSKSRRARTARIRNGKIVYLAAQWTDQYKREIARTDPPLMWWDGPLPILPNDINKLFAEAAE